MGNSHNQYFLIENFKDNRIPKNTQQGTTKRRIVWKSLQLGKTKRSGGNVGKPCSKIIKKTTTKPT